jgi:hypothetical protein
LSSRSPALPPLPPTPTRLQATCAPDTCPEGYKKCGAYCWNDFLSDGLDFWQDDYCAAFMDSVAGCVPGCDAAFRR